MSMLFFFSISFIIVMSGKDVHVLITCIVLFLIKADVHVPLINSGTSSGLLMAVLLLLLIHFSAGKTSHITNTLFGCHTVAIESEESVQ